MRSRSCVSPSTRQLSWAHDGGIGAAGSLAVRWRDLVEGRLDASLMFVFAQHFADCSAAAPASSIAITPSAGLALGVENGPNGIRTKSWAVSMGAGEIQVRVRVPRADVTVATVEVAAGFMF